MKLVVCLTSLSIFLSLVFSGWGQEPENIAAPKRLSPDKVAWLSLIPGEGQFYNLQPQKGWLFLGAEAAALGGAAWTAAQAQREWLAYRRSTTVTEKEIHIYSYRQEQINKRHWFYIYGFIKAAAALDAYVNAHFFEIDNPAPKLSFIYEEEKVGLLGVFSW